MIDNGMVSNVQIADDCMAVIAGISATSVEGVSHLSGGMTKNILPFMETNSLKKGILIEKNENGIEIKLGVIIKQGYDVKTVCTKIQEKILESLESMLDIEVNSISIKVDGVEVSE